MYFFFLLFSATIFGQQSKISGTVLDQNNAPISFVTVLVNNVSEEKGASGAVFVKGTTTDDLGNFTLENLEHGNYTLHFSFIGFQPQTKSDLGDSPTNPLSRTAFSSDQPRHTGNPASHRV